MNVSMIAALVPGDAGAGSGAAADKDGAGEGFGVAVKDAEQHHGRKAKGAHAGARAQADAAANADKGAEAETSPDETSDTTEGATATGDLLGRLLGASFLPTARTPAPPADVGNGDGDQTADGGEAQGELEERIVISTVADLAGAKSDDQAKRVALRVTGMETHFEPLDGASKLVDVDPARTAASAETGSDKASVPTVKQPFAEILQRLGGARLVPETQDAEPSGDQASKDGRGEGAPAKHVAAQHQTETTLEKGGAKSWAIGTGASETAGLAATRDGQTTGQVINAQLAERIIGAFADQSSAKVQESSASAQTGSSQLLRMTAGGGALKTLSIQLEPQDLGRVDVSMRLVDGRLKVELAVSEPSTAAALAGDKHGLRKILEHAGFALDDAAITIVARDLNVASSASSPSAGDAGTGRQNASQDQSFGSNDNRRNGERSSSGDDRRSAPQPRDEEAAGAEKRQGGSVYL